MLKISRYKPLIFTLFLGLIVVASLMLNALNSSSTAKASDNSDIIQQFTVRVYEKDMIATKDGYPVYCILFTKNDGSGAFPYCGGDEYTNRYYGGNHHGNAVNIYTKVMVGGEYKLSMDNKGNILALNGANI